MDGDHSSGCHAREHAVVADEHVFDVGVGHDADPDDVARGTEIGGSRRDGGGGVTERLERRGAPRPDREGIALVHDAAGHRRALTAQPDESDAGHRGAEMVGHGGIEAPWALGRQRCGALLPRIEQSECSYTSRDTREGKESLVTTEKRADTKRVGRAHLPCGGGSDLASSRFRCGW